MKKFLFLMIAFAMFTIFGACEKDGNANLTKDSITVECNISAPAGSVVSIALVCENKNESVFYFENAKIGVNTLTLTGADARLAMASGDPYVSIDVNKLLNGELIYVDKAFIDLHKIARGINQIDYILK